MSIKNTISDTLVMSGRVIKHTLRSVDTIITVVIMPIMMMLMFVYVFGGSMDTGSVKYVNYIVPGILLFCIASGVAYSSLRINNDVSKGIFERFRTMPIAKSSILGGHVLASFLLNTVSVVIIMIVAFIIGFRPVAGMIEWLLVALILSLNILAMTWIAVTFGLLAKSFEGAGVFSYILMLLLFISSAFSSTASMPYVLQVFAENQPMTPIIESVRALLMGLPVGNNAILAIAWCIGIFILFYLLAMKAYKNVEVKKD